MKRRLPIGLFWIAMVLTATYCVFRTADEYPRIRWYNDGMFCGIYPVLLRPAPALLLLAPMLAASRRWRSGWLLGGTGLLALAGVVAVYGILMAFGWPLAFSRPLLLAPEPAALMVLAIGCLSLRRHAGPRRTLLLTVITIMAWFVMDVDALTIEYLSAFPATTLALCALGVVNCVVLVIMAPALLPAGEGLCPNCGYDLTAIDSGTCPECGQTRRVAVNGP